MRLAELIQQPTFASAAQEAVLNVFATESWVSGEITAALSPHGVTQAQYNVLRILRGSHPDRLACSDIGDRLVDRTPDVTRLLIRLEAQGLVERRRAKHDRRVVEVAITPAGLDTLAKLDDPVTRVMDRVTGRLSEDDLKTLCDLLERMRDGQE